MRSKMCGLFFVMSMVFLVSNVVQYTMFTNQTFKYAANYVEDTGFVALSTMNHIASAGYVSYSERKKRELGKWKNNHQYCMHMEDTHLIMVIRIMKTGSTVLATLLSELSSRNRYVLDLRRMKTDRESADLVANEFVQYFDSFRKRTVHAAHGLYIDFEHRGKPRPVYLTMMRNPVRRAISQYNYVHFGDRGKWIDLTRGTNQLTSKSFDECIRSTSNACLKFMNLQLRMICGTSSECFEEPPSRRTLETAKRNIEKDFLVVGIVEQFKTSLRVMESVLPSVLKGLVSEYEKMGESSKYLRYNPMSSESHGSSSSSSSLTFNHEDYPNIPQDVFDFVKQRQLLEIELYEFVRNRFHRDVAACLLHSKDD